MTDEEGVSNAISRRGFLELASVGGLASLGGVEPVVAQTALGTDVQDESLEGLTTEIDSPGVLLGPIENRPDPGSEYFEQFETGPELVYMGFGRDRTIFYRYDNQTTDWIQMTGNPTTQTGEVRVEDFSSFFNHTFARPEAPDDKNWAYTSADITKDGSEVELASSTILQSEQRGNYPPGGESIPGVAFRVTNPPSGGECFAGYFLDTDNDNAPDDGFGFGVDGSGAFTFIAKNGSLRRVYRDDWNGPEADKIATNPFTTHYPRICRFPHLFYGGGSISYRIVEHTDEPASYIREVHIETPVTAAESGSPFNDGPPIDQPNLPVSFASNGLTNGLLRANAAHYEIGQDQGETRVNGEHYSVTSISDTGWTPLLSWRKRDGWEMVNVKPLQIVAVAATNDVKLELQLGSVLSSPSWSLPTNTPSDETAVEVALGGSISSTGDRRWSGYATAGQGNSMGDLEAAELDFNLPADKVITLAAQGDGGQADATGAVNWKEFF